MWRISIIFKFLVIQSSESLGVLTSIFPSAPVVQGWTTACDWLEAPLLGHSPCYRFIESCPQGVLRTIRVVIQPESSGWLHLNRGEDSWFWSSSFWLLLFLPKRLLFVSILLLEWLPWIFFQLFDTLQQNLAIASSSNFLCLFSNRRRSSDRTNKWPLRMTLMWDLDLWIISYFQP